MALLRLLTVAVIVAFVFFQIGAYVGRQQAATLHHQSRPHPNHVAAQHAARLAPVDVRITPAGAGTCATAGTGCAGFLLGLMNAARGTPAGTRGALALDWSLAHKTPSCENAVGHAQAERASGTIWHVNAAYPRDSFPTDILCSAACAGGCMALAQNTGMAYGAKLNAVQADFAQMMAEAHDPATCAAQTNHACTILSTLYHRVGIGIAGGASGPWFVVEDFVP